MRKLLSENCTTHTPGGCWPLNWCWWETFWFHWGWKDNWVDGGREESRGCGCLWFWGLGAPQGAAPAEPMEGRGIRLETCAIQGIDQGLREEQNGKRIPTLSTQPYQFPARRVWSKSYDLSRPLLVWMWDVAESCAFKGLVRGLGEEITANKGCDTGQEKAGDRCKDQLSPCCMLYI